jgi:transcriptional regulator with XRE-family HTH domain
MDRGDLASCLRSWRDRLAPEEAGLPAGAHRRAPGLRREELAQLAGLSVDYLTRLEQGRASHPSQQVVGALARALRVTAEEEAHLYRVAGHPPPGSGRINRHLTPGVQRVMDRLRDVPVMVVDAAWTVVAWNPLAGALMGDLSPLQGRERNVVWRHFTGLGPRSPVVRTEAETEVFELEVVADLHAALGRHPEDPELQGLIADLRQRSERFAQLWETRPAAVHTESRKTFEHPEVGRLTLDCDKLLVHGSDLRLVIYTAAPGSPDDDALQLLGVVGLQRIGA